MRSALRTVDDNERIGVPSYHLHDLAHRIHCAERVRHVAERDNPGAMSQERSQSIEIDSAVARQLAYTETCAPLDRQLLPWDEVRVMLECRDHYVVAAADVLTSPRRSDEIDRFGCTAGEDQAIRVGDAKEPRDSHSRAAVAVSRRHGKAVCSPMRIGVARLVELAHRVEHNARLLRS